jgi:hypothetical protein
MNKACDDDQSDSPFEEGKVSDVDIPSDPVHGGSFVQWKNGVLTY